MRVQLIAHTVLADAIPDYQWSPDHGVNAVEEWGPTAADELAEMAGRLCYLSWDRPNPATRSNDAYLANIIAQRHFSVLEHASATFYIDGVTRNFTHELIRHRHLSFSEVSQRYVDVSEFPFVQHPGIPDSFMESVEEGVDEAKSTYRQMVYQMTHPQWEYGNQPRKQARQAARHVLPGGMETKILVTGNMRAWRDVLEKRLPPTADAEFREVAKLILAKLKEIAPHTFQDFTEEGRIEVPYRYVVGANVDPNEVKLSMRPILFPSDADTEVHIGIATFEGEAA